jgi:cell wall-associated NlpC family hydrolase
VKPSTHSRTALPARVQGYEQRRPWIKARLLGLKAQALTAALMFSLLAAAPAQALPTGDTVTRFLRENQLVDAALAATQSATQTATEVGAGLLDQVRDGASDLVINAMNFLGVPYRRGGNTAESGFDCSGFTRHVFEHSIGLLLPRRSAEQANASSLVKVQQDDLKPGDLVFFNTMRKAFSHVGIYIGDGKFVHAPRTGQQIKVEDMRASYWTKRFNGARRATELTPDMQLQLQALGAGTRVSSEMSTEKSVTSR